MILAWNFQVYAPRVKETKARLGNEVQTGHRKAETNDASEALVIIRRECTLVSWVLETH